MNEEIKGTWLTALRSGEYKQGAGFLKQQGGEGFRYCCLGVLCELAVKAGVIDESSTDQDEYVHEFKSNSSYLPAEVAEWAGVHYQGKIYYENRNGYVRIDLASLNDYKLDFAGIADVIEKEF